MQEGFDPKNEKRSILLRLLLEKGFSAKQALKIIEPMRGKTDEEKERMAAHLILKYSSNEEQTP